jgi:methylmalonyl-CoA epimerase
MPNSVTQETIRVDHVSIAVPSIAEALPFFQRHFPIEMNVEPRPGYTSDFMWCDFYIGQFKIELIEPAGDGSFVERFLHKRGSGLHHWSLGTSSLAPLLDRMQADGVRIVDRFENANGNMTGFISPRSAHGVLVQFWQPDYPPDRERPTVAELVLRDGGTMRMRVDHVAIAVRDIEATLRFFERHFPFQLRRPPHPGWDGTFLVASFYVNGYKVELIQEAPGRSGFVGRFIERRGEGFHHLSIDVDRLDAYVEQLEADGVRVVDKSDLRSGHKTAFISPRSAHGVLIQLWQAPEFRS